MEKWLSRRTLVASDVESLILAGAGTGNEVVLDLRRGRKAVEVSFFEAEKVELNWQKRTRSPGVRQRKPRSARMPV
jgi:hypothetical protein